MAAAKLLASLVVSSVPLSIPKGGAARDSWSNADPKGVPEEGGTGFAVERDQILRELRLRGVKNLVFLAADVHHAEIIRLHPTADWSFHEFIAGPLAASFGRPHPLDQGLNPRSLWSLDGIANFGEIAVDATGLTLRVIDVEGRVRHTHTVPALGVRSYNPTRDGGNVASGRDLGRKAIATMAPSASADADRAEISTPIRSARPGR